MQHVGVVKLHSDDVRLQPPLLIFSCRRRLELFGEDHNIRPGWVTVGNKITESNFKPIVRICFASP